MRKPQPRLHTASPSCSRQEPEAEPEEEGSAGGPAIDAEAIKAKKAAAAAKKKAAAKKTASAAAAAAAAEAAKARAKAAKKQDKSRYNEMPTR